MVVIIKMEVIKPKKENDNERDNNSLINPVMYLVIGIMLAFYSNKVVQIFFYIIGVLLIIYGIKSFIEYRRNKELVQIKNINLSIAIISILIGVLLMILSNALEVSIRYVLGFFLIYMGISRLLTQYSFRNYKTFTTLSNVVLVILGVYSILVSNAVFVIIGWILIANAIILLWEYFRK